jgi:hypothetical protein
MGKAACSSSLFEQGSDSKKGKKRGLVMAFEKYSIF